MSISKKLRNSKGFTLVELLVVIAIIGILATLLLLQLGTARAKARDARRIADISQLRTVAELYSDDNAGYPLGITPANGVMNEAALTSYIAGTQLPTDPSSGADYPYAWLPAGAVASKYHLWSDLERSNASAFRADSDVDSRDAGPWAGGDGTISQVNAAVAGAEACAAGVIGDCLYDLGIQ